MTTFAPVAPTNFVIKAPFIFVKGELRSEAALFHLLSNIGGKVEEVVGLAAMLSNVNPLLQY